MKTFLVDTHAHLGDKMFDDDRAEVLERARKGGVSAVIAVSETLADAQRNLELAQRHPLLKPAAGLYPTYLDREQAEAVKALIRKERRKHKQDRRRSVREGIFVSLSVYNERRVLRDRRKVST